MAISISVTFVRAHFAVVLGVATFVVGAGCAVQPRTPQPPPPPRTASFNLPNITPLPETKELQSKAGVSISVAPVPYKLVDDVKRDEQVVDTGTQRVYQMGSAADVPVKKVRRTVTYGARTEPSNLQFIVTISNQLPRVFRGQGTIVQFNANGKVVPIGLAGYKELSECIIPPGQQQQVSIYGPPIDTMPDKPCMIGVSLYDVVTKMDAAGNVTEKQNYDWVFNYAVTAKTKEIPHDQSEEVVLQAGPATAVPDQPQQQAVHHRKH